MSAKNNEVLLSTMTQYKITVLLVDDQPIVAAAVKQMLAPEQDIVFHYCQDPAKAIEMAIEISPTVILQDLIMPETDGLTLVKFFRAYPRLKDIPLIVLSSKEEALTKAEAFEVGANDYLVKLPDRVELVARIRYHSKGYINLLQRNEAYDALASELARAAAYVASLLPSPLREDPIRTCWRFIPSAQLGGDSFGYHWIDDTHFSMYLLDVCDHGVGSALLSVSALNVLKFQTLPDTDFKAPDQVLTALNKNFQMSDHNDLFFTIWYGVLNTETYELTYASAGHPPALLSNGDALMKELTTQCFLIGGFTDSMYVNKTVHVDRPATLFIFSDGVYEVKQADNKVWNVKGLNEYLCSNCGEDGSEIDELYRHLQIMGGEEVLNDDFSMMKIDFI